MRRKVKAVVARLRPIFYCLLPLVLVAVLASAVSCVRQAPTCADITAKEAYEMLGQQEVVVLDVRAQEEYNYSHIPDALLIPLPELGSRLSELNPTEHILVYDYSNDSSKEAANVLIANGFLHVYNMKGGLTAWRAYDFPMVWPYTDLNSEEAYDMMSHQDVIVVDLRTQEQYDSGHIPDALLIPSDELESKLGELEPTDYILVYHNCVSCSRESSHILIDNGFLHVYHLEGGIDEWQTEGFPIIPT